jgi:2,5-diketo-D-gluconate reductase A
VQAQPGIGGPGIPPAGVAEAIAGSGLERDQLFITTKLWNKDQGHDRALRAFEGRLGRLGQEYVHLYLIHWPARRPARGIGDASRPPGPVHR